MDEPLAALDAQRKADILPWLEQLHRHLDIPVVYVTHAIDEVVRLADHLVVLEQGKLLASGPVIETAVAARPAAGHRRPGLRHDRRAGRQPPPPHQDCAR